MYLILQQDVAEDFVIATGITTEVREFARKAFKYVGVTIEYEGMGLNEKAIVTAVENDEWKVKKGDIVIEIDKRYFRPTEVDLLIGDATKARTKLGWSPKHNLDDLIQDMMDADIKLFKKEILLNQSGFTQNRQFE